MLFILFALGVFAVLGCKSPPGLAPILELTKPVVDLGVVHAGETVRGKFTIRNGGNAPLVLEAIKTSCSCTSVDFAKSEIAAGESQEIGFSIKVPEVAPKVSESISFESNAINGRSKAVEVIGRVEGRFHVTPRRLDFGVIEKTQLPQEREVRVKTLDIPEAKPAISTRFGSCVIKDIQSFEMQEDEFIIMVEIPSVSSYGAFNDNIEIAWQLKNDVKQVIDIPVSGKIVGGISCMPEYLLFQGGKEGLVESQLKLSGFRPGSEMSYEVFPDNLNRMVQVIFIRPDLAVVRLNAEFPKRTSAGSLTLIATDRSGTEKFCIPFMVIRAGRSDDKSAPAKEL